MNNPHADRANMLIEQGRFDLAEAELRQALGVDPDNGRSHALLALCLLERERYEEATREAEAAVRLEPDAGFSHYVHAVVLDQRNHLRESRGAIMEAIRLEPWHAGFFSLLGSLELQEKRWQQALDAANRGLQADPEHPGCNNVRARALVQLGRRGEAGATLEAALARNPEDAFSHANMGWTLLEKGERKKALEHFREALRLDPTLDYARAGIVEALKAGNPIYWLLLQYFLWAAKLSSQAGLSLVVGLFMGYQGIVWLAGRSPTLAPFLKPLIYAYIAFAFLTWMGPAFFNLLLRLNKYGRHALSREQVIASNWIGGVLLLALIIAAAEWLIVRGIGFTPLALVLLTIPLSGVFHCSPGWPRWVMVAVTALLGGMALAPYGLLIFVALKVLAPQQVEALASWMVPLFLGGILASSFGGSWLATVRVRK